MILLIIGGLCFYKLSKMEVVNLDSGEESYDFPIEKKHTKKKKKKRNIH